MIRNCRLNQLSNKIAFKNYLIEIINCQTIPLFLGYTSLILISIFSNPQFKTIIEMVLITTTMAYISSLCEKVNLNLVIIFSTITIFFFLRLTLLIFQTQNISLIVFYTILNYITFRAICTFKKNKDKSIKECLYKTNSNDINEESLNFFIDKIEKLDSTDKIKLLFVAKEYKKPSWAIKVLKKEPTISQLSGECELLIEIISDGDINTYKDIKEYGLFNYKVNPYLSNNTQIDNYIKLIRALKDRNKIYEMEYVYSDMKEETNLQYEKMIEEIPKWDIETLKMLSWLELTTTINKNKDQEAKSKKIKI